MPPEDHGNVTVPLRSVAVLPKVFLEPCSPAAAEAALRTPEPI